MQRAFIFIFYLSSFQVFCQSALNTFTTDAPMYMNPAFAGSTNAQRVTGVLDNQGFGIAFDALVKNIKGGIGIDLRSDSYDRRKLNKGDRLKVTYSPKFTSTNNFTLAPSASFGIGGYLLSSNWGVIRNGQPSAIYSLGLLGNSHNFFIGSVFNHYSSRFNDFQTHIGRSWKLNDKTSISLQGVYNFESKHLNNIWLTDPLALAVAPEYSTEWLNTTDYLLKGSIKISKFKTGAGYRHSILRSFRDNGDSKNTFSESILWNIGYYTPKIDITSIIDFDLTYTNLSIGGGITLNYKFGN